MAVHASLGHPRTKSTFRVRCSLIPASGDLQAQKLAQCVQAMSRGLICLHYACIAPIDRPHYDLDRAPYHDGAPIRFVAG